MLKYQYKLNTTHKNEEIELDDFFISSDLSYISGTTSIDHRLCLNDKLWVTSSYFPMRLAVNVTKLDIVNRNGYITYPQILDIYTVEYVDINDKLYKDIKYVEYNGNTYYQDTSNFFVTKFNIDGVVYQADINDNQLTICSKAYIEDNQVTINGYAYSVILNKNIAYTTLLDSIGKKVSIPDSWGLENIVLKPTQIQKIAIGGNEKDFIKYKTISYYGHQPYIIYDGDRYNLEAYRDDDADELYLALYINGVEYKMNGSFSITGDEYQLQLENYSQYELLDSIEVETKATIDVDGEVYTVFYEPCEPYCSKNICIDLENNHPAILPDDILDIQFKYTTGMLPVRADAQNKEYVYCNGRRCNRIKGLCDKVILDNVEYQINYPVVNGEYSLGMVGNIVLSDSSTIYFVVKEMYNGYVTKLSKVKKNDNDDWVESFTMYNSTGGTVTYGSGSTYTVNNCDGIILNGMKIPIEVYRNVDEDSNLLDEYEYVNATINANYKLKVKSLLGPNKLICQLDVNEKQFSTEDYIEVTKDAYDSIISGECTIMKRPNCFGRVELLPENWVNEAYDSKEATSIYDIMGIKNDVKVHKSLSYFNVPLSFSKNINNDFLREDLIIGSYYDEKVDDSINKIVDMDKDMYTPVCINAGNTPNFIEKMTFNLHFRTRDMSTWTINEDEGYKISGGTYNTNGNYIKGGVKVNLGVNSEFCNWFVTDYYPYNQVSYSASSVYKASGINENISNMMDRSDLLGLLYFTTDDVKRKRKKLSKSFLRLTYFDSTDPDKQNMLGTSTLFFDCNHYYDIMACPPEDYIYEDVVMSGNGNRIGDNVKHGGYTECFSVNTESKPSVMSDVFGKFGESGKLYSNAKNLYSGSNTTYIDRLDSRIVVSDRNTTISSSEGFYAYILKQFADKSHSRTIYMKMEFFHAGIGIKIPMVLATHDVNGRTEAISDWTLDDLNTFKEGYELNGIHRKMYIPLTILYDKKFKQFVYTIGGDEAEKYKDAIISSDLKEWKFNLFELKTKAQ